MTAITKFWYLRNHRLFEQLNDDQVNTLCIVSNMKNINKNEIVFFSNTEEVRIFIVKVGVLKLCKYDSEGKEVITEMLQEGDIFGHFENSSNFKTDYAKALSDEVKLCYFEYDNFKKLLDNTPNLYIRYNELVQEKLLSFQQKYIDLVFKDVETRVIEFFKRYASHHGKMINGNTEMDMMLTHQEIADYTASSRQSVTTFINKLVKDKIIIYEGRRKVIIPDLSKL